MTMAPHSVVAIGAGVATALLFAVADARVAHAVVLFVRRAPDDRRSRFTAGFGSHPLVAALVAGWLSR